MKPSLERLRGRLPAGPGLLPWVGGLVLTLLLAVLVLRIVQLQALPSGRIAGLRGQNIAKRELLAFRGALLDRRGTVIAASELRHRLFVDPAFAADAAAEQAKRDGKPELEVKAAGLAATQSLPLRIASVLGYSAKDAARFAALLEGRAERNYVVLDELMDPERVAAYFATQRESRENKPLLIPGLKVEPISHRQYPHGVLAGQLVGFVGRDGKGLEGLEGLLDDQLLCENGEATTIVNRRRETVWVSGENYRLPKDGRNVRLSIDQHLQAVAEEQLAATALHNNAQRGQLIVMQPFTGEILAMANWPYFDPNQFKHYSSQERTDLARNRCVADTFEPGSIFKPVVWATVTDRGLARPEEKVDTTREGAWKMPCGRLLHDAHAQGLISWQQVLMYSSNIGMAKGAIRMSPGELHDVVRTWGFGDRTGIGLRGEGNGIVNPRTKWTDFSMGSVPMGHEISTTPLQIMRAYCAIANGGMLVRPRLTPVDEPALRPGAAEAPPPARVLSDRGARLTRETLRLAVTDAHGTGRLANSKYWDIFGKTGTAELPNPAGGYFKDRYISSFVAGAPLESPRVVVGLFLHDPDKSIAHYGGVVAAPYVRNVIEETLRYYGVPSKAGTDLNKMYEEWDARRAKLREELKNGGFEDE